MAAEKRKLQRFRRWQEYVRFQSERSETLRAALRILAEFDEDLAKRQVLKR